MRWLNDKELTCPYSGSSCWGLYVVARDGCPQNLYVELSIEDAAGTIIGMTNDAVGAVPPKKRVKMIFTTFDESAHTASVSKVSCY